METCWTKARPKATISDDGWATAFGSLAILALVLANGFFVTAEFAPVEVHRSRVAQLVAGRRVNVKALLRATDHLDAHLAATQLGLAISSQALGWVGESALAHVIEPDLAWLLDMRSTAVAHTVAVGFSFVLITSLDIALGEPAPMSLALQRSERTALAVLRPLGPFLLLLHPATSFLDGLGNGSCVFAGCNPAPARAAAIDGAVESLGRGEPRDGSHPCGRAGGGRARPQTGGPSGQRDPDAEP